MHNAILLAFTFFASIDTIAATPAQHNIEAVLSHREASAPAEATVAFLDGKRIIVLQSPEMAVEVRSTRKTRTLAAANVVGQLASQVANKKVVEKQA